MLVNDLADTPGQGVDDYQAVYLKHFFGKGNRCIPHDARDDEILLGERACR